MAPKSYGRTTLVPTLVVKIPKADFTTLENLACLTPFSLSAESINAYKRKDSKAPFSYAEVKCKAHGEIAGEPTYYSYFCLYVQGKWACEKPDFHLLVKIKDRVVDVTTTEKIAPIVQSSLKKISHNYQYVNKVPIDKIIGNACAVSSAASPEEFDFMCAAYFKVSLFCPQPESSRCPGILSMQDKY